MDARIILAGQTPDFVGTIARANQAAQQQNEFGRQNALAQLYQDQGAQIMAGDTGALNALARFDPAAALGVQTTRQGMAFDQRRLEILNEEERRAAQQYAAGLSAAEAQAQAARIEEGVRMGMAAQTPEEWDALMSRTSPDLVGMFDQRQMLAAKYMSMAEVLKGQQGPEFRKASPDEAAEYGATGGQFGPDGRFYPINPPSGMSIESGPDGQMRITQGPGAGLGGKPFTEAQSKDVVFATRARGALEALNPVADALSGRMNIIADKVPLGFGREFQDPNYQVARNAGDEFLQALLRKDSGAAITEPEQGLYGTTYLPQPGDGPEVLRQKAEARERAVAAIEAGMSASQIIAQERALNSVQVVAPPAQSGPITIDGFTIEAIE